MKYCLLFLLWLPVRVAWAQKTPAYQELIKLVETPGAVFIQDSLFMDEAEVANNHWLEYLYRLHKDSTEAQYLAARPDSTSWIRVDSAAYIESHTIFNARFYPLTGVTYEQAVRYSRWRTAEINKRIHAPEYLRKHPKLRGYNFRVEYRLPTVREWELAAAGKLDPALHPLGILHPPLPGSRQERKQLLRKPDEITNCLVETGLTPATAGPVFRMEFRVQEGAYLRNTGQPTYCRYSSLAERFIPEYIYANPANAYGLFNMIGNVAELTATPGVAKGGSFRHSIKVITVQTNFPYTEPQAWLGFRCAATVYISPKP